ncbi:MAG: hypothetical protein Q4E51_03010 [Lachnospiraceae bacterium]|nr:hypothetical protein [Lachnospiraceae bacterium]
MINKILYIQSNDNVANMFKERFNEADDFELIVATTGEEALSILEQEKDVLLLLVDIKIPDMRLHVLVERTRKIAPKILLNVCIDVVDPLLISKLANRYGIHKIYVAPWNIDEIADEIRDSIEIALINEEINLRESRVDNDKLEIETTIKNLTEMLKKQKYSYNKLSTIFRSISSAVKEDYKDTIDFDRKDAFAEDVFRAMLKMQTTGSFDIDSFEDLMKSDLNELKEKCPGMEIGNIVSCLFGGVTKTSAENIRFAVWLIARYYSEFYERFSYEVVSHFLTTTRAEFRCIIALSPEYSSEDIESRKEERSSYRAFVFTMLERLAEDARREEADGKIVIIYEFPVDAT